MNEKEIPHFVMVESDEKIVGVFIKDITSVDVACWTDGNYMKIYFQDDEYYELEFADELECRRKCAELVENVNRYWSSQQGASISYSSGGFYPGAGG